MIEKIETIVLNAVIEIGRNIDNSNLKSAEKTTRLYGKDGNLDSLSLIRLAISIEENLSDELDLEISIVDDKAMSQTRSPFRDVQSLIDYIVSICEL
jgi:acyl carrier protein